MGCELIFGERPQGWALRCGLCAFCARRTCRLAVIGAARRQIAWLPARVLARIRIGARIRPRVASSIVIDAT